MKKRQGRRQNPQIRAFELFSRGMNIFQVAENLDITIAETRKHHSLFLQSEQISPERKKEITEFLEDGYRKERDICLRELETDLSKKRDDFATPEKFQTRLGFILGRYGSVNEILIYFGKAMVPAHWLGIEESRLLDKMDKICNN